jgi:hypothetical protein
MFWEMPVAGHSPVQRWNNKIRATLDTLVFRDSRQRYESGGDNTGEVQSPTFQGENPRSSLNWLCVAMALVEALF